MRPYQIDSIQHDVVVDFIEARNMFDAIVQAARLVGMDFDKAESLQQFHNQYTVTLIEA